MKVIRDLHWSPRFADGTVATAGEFDGVHRGHQVVLLELFRAAVVEGCPSVVVTFDPSSAGAHAGVPSQLTDMAQKLELLESLGVDAVVILPWGAGSSEGHDTHRDAAIDELVDEVFTKRLKARAVVVGEDFNFSPRRRLTIDTFRDRSVTANFRVIQIPVDSRKTSAGEVISARTIRTSIAAGDVASAARMMGRPFELRSVVSIGERRGRTLGYPTANLPVPPTMQLPADGVYACWYHRPNGSRFPAAVNIGKRPTFHDFVDHSLIEAHLLDFSGDLYEEWGRLQFVDHLRAETKFPGVDALRHQLDRDVESVRSLLKA